MVGAPVQGARSSQSGLDSLLVTKSELIYRAFGSTPYLTTHRLAERVNTFVWSPLYRVSPFPHLAFRVVNGDKSPDWRSGLIKRQDLMICGFITKGAGKKTEREY